jgi:hypothetical protein
MLQLRRGSAHAGEDGPGRRRPSSSLLVSIAVHVVVAVVFGRALSMGYSFTSLFERERSTAIPAERIGFLRLPQSSAPAVAQRSGGDGRPVTATSPRELVAPGATPSAVPPTAPAPDVPVGGSGEVVGSGGITRGIRPSYNDARVWTPAPGNVIVAPKTAQQRLDSAVSATFGVARDSMEAARILAEGQRKPGDWTVKGKDGSAWGIDQQAIRLGKLSIPNALLALLPTGAIRGNPTEMDRDRRLAAVREDIMLHVQREISEDDFRKSVREIRQRKERERANRTTAKASDGGARSQP